MKILPTTVCGIFLVPSLICFLRAQGLQDPKAAISSILETPSADLPKSIAMVREMDPDGAKDLWWKLARAGSVAIDAGDWSRSKYLYSCAIETARRAQNELWLAEAESRLGSVLLRLNDYQSSENHFLHAVEIYEKSRSEINLVNTLGTLSVLYIRRSQYDLAEQVSNRALALVTSSQYRDSIPYKFGEAVVSNSLGAIAAWRGADGNAVKHLERAVELYGELDKATGGYKPAMLGSLVALGKVFHDLGDYRKALSYYSDVLNTAEKNGYRSLQHAVMNDMGRLYMDQADAQTATQFFTRSLKIAAEIGDREAGITANCNLGVANERQGKYDAAGGFFSECLKRAEQAEAPRFVIPALEGLATVSRRKGQFQQALASYDRALQEATKLGDRMRQSELAWGKAGIYYDLGDYGQSVKLASRAAELADEIHDANFSELALTMSGKGLLAAGEYEPAQVNLQKAIEKIDLIRSQVGGQEQQRAFFFGRNIEPFYLMVDLLLKTGRLEEALVFAEKARSRSLLDMIDGAKLDVGKSMSPAEREEEQKLNRQLVALNTQLYHTSQQLEPTRGRIDDLRSSLEQARIDYDSFMDRVFAIHPEMRADRGQVSPFSILDAKAMLGNPDAAVLEFVTLEDKAYLFTLMLGDTDQIQVKAYPIAASKKKLTAIVDEFRERITNNNLLIDKTCADIFQLLLGSAAPTLKGKKTLIFVPDDVLWDLPFQALKDGTGHYLIENYVVFYAPSLTALREMKRKQSSSAVNQALATNSGPEPTPMLLAFGNPALSPKTIEAVSAVKRNEKLGPLPAAKREVETLGTLYGPSRSAVFVGDQASEDRAKADMSRFRILHFATHGILDGTNPLYSHVVLSQSAADSNEDGLLEAREIMNMNLNADLAVLSACETARGRISGGEGVIGMSWALFVAGCPTSVVTQWSVESNSTAKLMIDFHRALLSLNKSSAHITGSAEALRQAALTMLKTPGYSHPLFWAGFIVVGNGF